MGDINFIAQLAIMVTIVGTILGIIIPMIRNGFKELKDDF